jgi:hypothetical protein
MLNPQQVVLVSDRLLSCNGVPVNEESNKTFLFTCRNARLAIGYTGVAELGKFVTREWLPVALMESASPDFLMAPTIERFKDRATRDLKNLRAKKPSDKHLSIVLAGYCYDEEPPRIYCWLVSNFEGCCDQHRPLGSSSDQFMAFYHRDKRPAESDVCLLLPVGVAKAVIRQNLESLHSLLHDNKPAEALVGKGIEVIRATAQSVRGKGRIGEQCNSIVLPSNPEIEPIAEYHSAKIATRRYLPGVINACGDDSGVFALNEGWVEGRTADEQPTIMSVPKVGRNQPCPCGNGKKYKKCHGQTSRS